MILSNKQIVWTPILGPKSLGIVLNADFARSCARVRKCDTSKLARIVWSRLYNPPSHMPSNFLDISEGILPKGIYLLPGEGVWLELDSASASQTDPNKPLKYNGHNENLLADRHLLMSAFASWADVAAAVLERN